MTYRRLTVASAALALIGLAIAGYLTYVHYRGISPVCAIAHGCVKVQSSEWSKLAGVPVAVLGLLGYVGILVALRIPGELGRLAAACVALTGLAFSAYLTYRELFTIKAICIWCVGSAVVMLLLAVLTSLRLVLAPLDDGPARRAPRKTADTGTDWVTTGEPQSGGGRDRQGAVERLSPDRRSRADR